MVEYLINGKNSEYWNINVRHFETRKEALMFGRKQMNNAINGKLSEFDCETIFGCPLIELSGDGSFFVGKIKPMEIEFDGIEITEAIIDNMNSITDDLSSECLNFLEDIDDKDQDELAKNVNITINSFLRGKNYLNDSTVTLTNISKER